MRQTARSFSLFLFLCAAMLAAAPAAATPTGCFVNVADHGAAADGKTLSTRPLQGAIDLCFQRGGGTVYVPPGTYLTGTLVLRSNVTLHLEAGATLLGSRSLADYPSHVPQLRSYTDLYTERSALYAERAENIAIVGRGAIDGQGRHFPGRHAYKSRPYLIRLVECRNVRVRDVTLAHSASWTLHLLGCEDVVVDGARINTLPVVNDTNDGIDVDSCRRVRIANCDVTTEDDAIVLKSTTPRRCENVAVTNCTLRSERNGFKLGTESVGGFRNIVMSNCAIYDTRNTGITLLAVDGGVTEHVSIDNVVMHNVRGTAIFLRLGNRARPYWVPRPGDKSSDAPSAPGMGAMRNITISNVQAAGCARTGIVMTGIPGHAIKNVTLSNVRVGTVGGGPQRDARRLDVPEMEKDYPNVHTFGPMPAYGLYGRHLENVRLGNVELSFGPDDARPALVLQDVRQLDLFGLWAETGPKTDCVIRLRHVDGAFIHGCRLRRPIGQIVEQSKDCAGIRILGNAF